jgi:hypothetical protein
MASYIELAKVKAVEDALEQLIGALMGGCIE